MDKREFLRELEKSLRGKVDDGELNSQIEYYSSYINSEISHGRTESEVLEALGDPRLIARTIVQAYHMKDDPLRNRYRQGGNGDGGGNGRDDGAGRGFKGNFRSYLIIAIIAVVLLVIMSFAFSVVRALFPILLIAFVIFVIVRRASR